MSEPGYPQSRVLDLTAPYVPPPVAGSGLPVPSATSDDDREQTEREVAEDRRAEHRLVLWEALALLAVAAIVVARLLWLA